MIRLLYVLYEGQQLPWLLLFVVVSGSVVMMNKQSLYGFALLVVFVGIFIKYDVLSGCCVCC